MEELPASVVLRGGLRWRHVVLPHSPGATEGEGEAVSWLETAMLGEFNQALINWYQNGHHYIGKHRDDESKLLPQSPILSISLGATRTFRIRDWRCGTIVLDLPLTHQMVVIMGGYMQKTHQHEVPKVGGRKGEVIGRRVNITFRQFAPTDSAPGEGSAEERPRKRPRVQAV
eukprot:GGOE01019841.1.p1 GENE.GGOE01019841.1~~GGOE01019841.1.p1  ORF type:complete len:184 (+),score=29.45 GGOE01019841.1:37-552(+)